MKSPDSASLAAPSIAPLPAEIEQAFSQLKAGARQLRQLSAAQKNKVLELLAARILELRDHLLEENKKDLQDLAPDATSAFRDRLTLTPERIDSMVESLLQVAALEDPVNEELETRTLKNGLRLRRVRAPLGVIFMIFESRPNVILEAFSLAFKSGNVIALRGGSDSSHSARVLYQALDDALQKAGLHAPHARYFYGMNDYNRAWVLALLARKDWIDIVVPRGSEKLIAFVQENARMPIIKNDRGLCHLFVDEAADLKMAARLVVNAKTQRPGVCNSLETALVHETIAATFFDLLIEELKDQALEFRADPESFDHLTDSLARRRRDLDQLHLAAPEDWQTEHLELILNCKVVCDLDEALQHIEEHGSHHSESIVTADEARARRFQNDVDAAVVYWNASTRFTDGFEFGLGGELGISTQKLHTRGPVGLRELTTARWIVDGSGQVRE